MKRILSFLLSVLMIFSVCSSFVIFAEGEAETEDKTAVINVNSTQGFASQLVTVTVDISNTEALYGATVKIKYDKALQLVSVNNPTQANGGYFASQEKSAIYQQGGGGINGEYVYVGLTHTGEAINKEAGLFVNLTFRIPQNAKVGNTYSVKIDSAHSKLATGVDTNQKFVISNGTISVLNYFGCGGDSHSFEEVYESAWTDLSNGYIRNTCTACQYTDIVINESPELDVVTYEGVAMNYTGKPSGIAPIFTVNTSSLDYCATSDPTFKYYDFEAGLMVYKNGELIHNELFYEEGKTNWEELVEEYKVYKKIENVSVYDKFEFRLYIRISDSVTKQQRIDYVVATLNGEEEITILNIAQELNVKAYPTEHQAYLNKVRDGLGQ